MPAGTLMLIAFFLILLFLLLLMTGFARGLRITLTVAAGRQVTIGRQVFPPAGPAGDTTTFLVDRELVTVGREDVAVTLDPGIDGSTRSFEVSRRGLKTLHLDANIDGRLVAYGCYAGTTRGSGLFVTPLAVETVPQCKWCPPDMIVCGINPRCGLRG